MGHDQVRLVLFLHHPVWGWCSFPRWVMQELPACIYCALVVATEI